jgi:hypothetical protein
MRRYKLSRDRSFTSHFEFFVEEDRIAMVRRNFNIMNNRTNVTSKKLWAADFKVTLTMLETGEEMLKFSLAMSVHTSRVT